MMANEIVHVRNRFREEKNVIRLRSWIEGLLSHVAEQEKAMTALKAGSPAKILGIVNDPRGRVESSE